MALPLRSGKNKKITKEDALQRVNDLLAQRTLSKARRRKKPKPVRYEITTNPQTGLRNFKGTYNPRAGPHARQPSTWPSFNHILIFNHNVIKK